MHPTVRLGAMFRRERAPEELIPWAERMDALGLDELWIVEDCFWGGGLTAVAVSLAATERIVVGMGLVPCVARNVAITAMEMAGVERMFPGRFIAGVGHGVESWMQQIGARPASQLAALEETVDALRRLLDGERLALSGQYVTLDDVQLAFPPARRPPILVGVTGPKGIDITRGVADGLLLPEGSSPAFVRAAIERLDKPAECVVYVLFAVDDDADAARSMVADSVAEFASGAVDARLAKLGVVDEVADADRVDRYAVAGSPDDCARAIDALVTAGATSVVVVPQARSGQDQDAQVRRLVVEVIPRMTT